MPDAGSRSRKRAAASAQDPEDDADYGDEAPSGDESTPKRAREEAEPESDEHDDRGGDRCEGAALEFSDSEDDEEELAVSKGRQRIIRENQGSTMCGTIKRIYLQNFMCHKQFTIDLSQINFISGRNGSGKSAILTAITVALGGKARGTGRGTSYKDLIRAGATTAKVVVHLRNDRESPYEHDKFGDEIIVERAINKSGPTTVKLMDKNHRVVYNTAEKLRAMIDWFDIQVDNPLQVLHQDTSKQFLLTNSPNDLYKMYMEGTLLDKLLERSIECEGYLTKLKMINETQETERARAEKAFKDADRRYQDAASVVKVRDQLATVRNMQAWAIVQEIEEDGEDKLKDIMEYKDETLPKLDEVIGTHEARKGQLKEECTRCMERLEAANEEARRFKETLAERTTQHADCRQKFKLAQDVLNRARSDVSSTETEHANLLSDIQRINDEKEQAVRSKNDELYEKRKQLTDLLEAARVEKEELELEKERADDALHELKDRGQGLAGRRGQKEEALNALRRQVESYKRAQQDSLAVWGDVMPEIVQEIKKHQRQFSRLPAGPLGQYCKLADDRWDMAMEGAVGVHMTSFIVDNKRDEQVLKDIVKSVCDRARKKGRQNYPSIICRAYTDRPHNLNATKSREGLTIADVLQIDNVWAANTLADLINIEKIILVPTRQEAFAILRGTNDRNTEKAFVLNGDEVKADSFFANKRGLASRFRKANSQAIAELTEQVQIASAELDGLKREIENVARQQQIAHNKRRMAMAAIEDKQREIGDLNDQLQELDDEVLRGAEVVDTELIEKEAAELEGKLPGLRAAVARATEHAKEAEERFKLSHLALKEFKNSQPDIAQEQAEMKDKIEKIQQKVKDLDARIATATKNKGDCQAKIAALEAELADVHELLKAKMAEAVQLCPKIEVPHSVDDLKKKEAQLVKRIAQLEREHGSMEELEAKRQRAEERLLKLQLSAQTIRVLTKLFERTLERRRMAYRSIATVQRKLLQNVFAKLLEEGGLFGRLRIVQKEKALIIDVQKADLSGANENHAAAGAPKGKKRVDKTRGLSGGEKSFTMTCLILGLWHIMGSPFRALDEFDVFMDMVNRRLATAKLLQLAEKHGDKQFIFLTPQDLSFLKSKNSDQVRVYTLQPPERNQGTLNFDATQTQG